MTIQQYARLGGLGACPYWQSHGDSPGEPLDPFAAAVLDLWYTVQTLGWDGAAAMGPHLTCSPYEATLVTEGVQWCDAQHREAQSRQTQRATSPSRRR